MTKQALVVDDDMVARLVLAHVLRREGWDVMEASDVNEAATLVETHHPTVVLADFSMPGGTGEDLARRLAEGPDRPAFVLITGLVDHPAPPEETGGHIDAYLTKPATTSSVIGCLRQLGLDATS